MYIFFFGKNNKNSNSSFNIIPFSSAPPSCPADGIMQIYYRNSIMPYKTGNTLENELCERRERLLAAVGVIINQWMALRECLNRYMVTLRCVAELGVTVEFIVAYAERNKYNNYGFKYVLKYNVSTLYAL